MPADVSGDAFAALLPEARNRRKVSQDEVIAATSVSRSTYLRWERGGYIGRPIPRQVTEVCRFLSINPVLAAVALGFGTPDDYERFSAPQDHPDAVLAEIARTFSDDTVPEAGRAALRHAVNGAYEAWRMAMAMHVPQEPAVPN